MDNDDICKEHLPKTFVEGYNFFTVSRENSPHVTIAGKTRVHRISTSVRTSRLFYGMIIRHVATDIKREYAHVIETPSYHIIEGYLADKVIHGGFENYTQEDVLEMATALIIAVLH